MKQQKQFVFSTVGTYAKKNAEHLFNRPLPSLLFHARYSVIEVKWSTLDITPNWAKLVSNPVCYTFDELTLYNVGGHESSCVVVAVELTASQVALDLKQVRIYKDIIQ